jgi:S-(hydroxymethyl)mycothiol dehydrogenase
MDPSVAAKPDSTGAQTIHCDAVVVQAAGSAPQLETICVEPPGAGEIRVRILASGVCHSDLHAQEGNFGRQFPYLLGHEATATVESIGSGVSHLRPGDTVMLNWRAPCHSCAMCLSGRASHCRRPRTAGDRMRRQNGDVLGRVLGLGTFSQYSVIAADQAIQVASDLCPLATSLIGCGVVTGVGAALFAAKVQPGQSVAVFGCGAVGMSVIQGARIARAATIVAIDTVAAKLEKARLFGATDTILAGDGDPVKQLRERHRGGVDHSFDAVGLPETLEQCIGSCAHAGSATLIGVPHPKAEMRLPLARFFYGRLSLRSTFYGDCLPSRDFPLLAQWYREGLLQLDAMVSERIALADVPEAFARMKRGEVLRSVIDLRGETASAV